MSRSRYDLIIFDWDGTLMDSAGKIARCFSAAITDVGIDSPDENAIRNIIGLGLTEAVSALLPGHGEAARAAVVERYREHFLHLDPGESELFPGVASGLKRLNAQGYLLAVATGKSRRGLERVLSATELQPLFAMTRCADETYSKPHPHAARHSRSHWHRRGTSVNGGRHSL